jgi:hypothetical protein
MVELYLHFSIRLYGVVKHSDKFAFFFNLYLAWGLKRVKIHFCYTDMFTRRAV